MLGTRAHKVLADRVLEITPPVDLAKEAHLQASGVGIIEIVGIGR